jgi:hypothetical protein
LQRDFSAKIETVTREKEEDDPAVYRAVAAIGGRSYAMQVLEDGTLMEKTLVIDRTEVRLAQCPASVRATVRQYSQGGTIGVEIIRSTVLGRHTFTAGVHVNGKDYVIEVGEDGLLISKSLDD